jgi:predicted ester cyclase
MYRLKQEKLQMDNKAIARQFYASGDTFDPETGDWSAVDAIVASDFQAHMAGFPPVGLAAFKQMAAEFATGFSGAHHVIEAQLAEGDQVATRVTWQGKHTGSFNGIPATQREVSITGYSMMRIENGRVVEIWPLSDSLSMMQQLGVLPSPSQQPE